MGTGGLRLTAWRAWARPLVASRAGREYSTFQNYLMQSHLIAFSREWPLKGRKCELVVQSMIITLWRTYANVLLINQMGSRQLIIHHCNECIKRRSIAENW